MINFINKTKFDPFTHQAKSKLAGTPKNLAAFNSNHNGHIYKEKLGQADLKRHYKRAVEISLLSTLVLMIAVFQIGRSFELKTRNVDRIDVKIEVADIPPTEQFRRPPPPPRPSLPVPTDEDSVPEDLTISSTEVDLTEIPPPPPPADDDEPNTFVPYDEPPVMRGGLNALLANLEYPKLARKTGIEGRVVAKVLVSKSGETKKVEILDVKPPGYDFEQSAIAALQKVQWKPAKQRDRDISTWVAIPVQFKLTN